MSDTTTSTEGNANVVAATITAGTAASITTEPKTFTQEQVDKIVQERLARAKQQVPDDYDTLKAKAAKLDELEEANKSEYEKLNEKYIALEKERNALVHENERRAWAAQVAREKGVPESVLRGDTLEEIQAHAQAILDSGLSHYSASPDNGEANSVDTVTAESIWSIQDPVKRVEAISKNLDKFK